MRPIRDSPVLASGLLLGCLAWCGMAALLLVRGKSIPWFSFWYNMPITLVFGSMALHLAASALHPPRPHLLARHAGVIVAWTLGATVLWFRLVSKSIDISGHMCWAVLLGIQCHVFGLPWWFIIIVWAVATQVLLLKLLVLGGSSGQSGLVAGLVLGALLWAITKAMSRHQKVSA